MTSYKLTFGEEFVLLTLLRKPGLSSYQIGQRWSTSTDDHWASWRVRSLRDLGLVRTDTSRRPWRHSLTEAGEAEARRRKPEVPDVD